ncbi:MAG: hypothetical protein LBM18_06455 [Oscillospiraceae bacterium]|jgi:hypothetical protein|nr:hypothetical protein [Oscillospiraceae bacterium]
MASSNKTANFQLNQWVPNDPVLMEDFNADNQRIDAVLGELDSNSMIRKLADVTVTQSGVKLIDFDLSGIDMTQYSLLWLNRVTGTNPTGYSLCCGVNHMEMSTNGHGSKYVRIQVGSDPGTYWSENSYSTTFSSYTGQLTFHMNGKDTLEWNDTDTRFRVKPSSWSGSTSSSIGGLAPTDLTSIQVKYDYNGTTDFPIGNRYSLVGLRKV